jgi:hypothetical protein
MEAECSHELCACFVQGCVQHETTIWVKAECMVTALRSGTAVC